MTSEFLVALLAALASIVAAVVAVFALVDARNAREQANDATRAANKALTRSAAADETAADALQKLAIIAAAGASAPAPEPKVAWEIGYHTGDLQYVRNSGDATAYKARVTGGQGIFTDEDSERDELRPGQTLIFGVMPTSAASSRRDITIEWAPTMAGDRQSIDYSVTPNR